MTDTRNEVIILNENQNPKNLEEKKEISEDEKSYKENQAQTQNEMINNNNPVPTTLVKVNTSLENIHLNLNKKDIIILPQETKEKLSISPCPNCQSEKYLLYIPETFFEENNQNNNKGQNPCPNESPNVNSENRTIKENQKYNIYFPILICESNHQRCLVCNQNPHESKFCDEQFLKYDHILSLYNNIKGIIPEEKKNDFDSLYNFALNKTTIK